MMYWYQNNAVMLINTNIYLNKMLCYIYSSVPARSISEGAAPCPYWIAPCPIYTRFARI